MTRKPHTPRYVGSGTVHGDDDANAAVRAALRAKKAALLDIYREIGIPPPERPVKAPSAPPPADTPTADPVAAEAVLVAARLRESPNDPVALRRAAELADRLEKHR